MLQRMGRKQVQEKAKKQKAEPKPDSSKEADAKIADPSFGTSAAAIAIDIFREGASAASMWFFLLAFTTKQTDVSAYPQG